MKDEENVAVDGFSLEPYNGEDDEVSRTNKAIILGLEEIIEELQYNNSNIDTLRNEFGHFRDENIEIFQKTIESKHLMDKMFKDMADDVSSIRNILFLVLIVIPVISFILMLVIMSGLD